jgi:acetyl esterase/lipase
MRSALLILACLAATTIEGFAGEQLFPHCTRQEDIVYGRKFGTALTMDVFTPKQHAKGLGVIFIVSGGWSSRHEDITQYAVPFIDLLAERGYTVFAVVHGSRPRYSIPEMIGDLERAVRYIRFHADSYAIDDKQIGICGASAGGHLALMLGTNARTEDGAAKDAVDRVSARVQAVASLCPPTDFLNYGQPGENALGRGKLQKFDAAFDFRDISEDGRTITPITDAARIRDIGRLISPVNHASADDPPTLLIHGDQDTIVPIQQSREMIGRLQAAQVPCHLTVRPGKDHGWPDYSPEIREFADWFDRHLDQNP